VAFALAIILALLLVASPWFWTFMGDLAGTTRTYDESARLTIRRTIEFSVTGQGAVDYELDVPLPKNLLGSESAYVQRSTKTDPTPTPLDEYKYGQHWMVWSGSDVTSKEIIIDYEFEVRTVVWNVASGDSADVDAIPQDAKDAYLGTEWKIDPTLPEIASLSAELTRLDDNVRDKLRSIYDYMNDNLVYETGRDGVPKDCLETLRDKTGDCDDQSILFCSLARAAGIPAWMEFGALYDPGQNLWGGHAWAKAYVPLIDGGGGAVCVDVVNREFFIRASNRFSDWESDGNGTHMEDYYNTLSYSSINNVQLDYSETYTGSYEAIGGKIRMVIGNSIPPFFSIATTCAKLAIPCEAETQDSCRV
jgi:transglutaminase-like putative cysteine protease